MSRRKTKPRPSTARPTPQPKTYAGTRDESGGLTVWVSHPDGTEVPLVHKRHEAMCFECGYMGDGPGDLALSMCADAIGAEDRGVQMESGEFIGRQAWTAFPMVLAHITSKLDPAVDWQVPADEVLHFVRKARP